MDMIKSPLNRFFSSPNDRFWSISVDPKNGSQDRHNSKENHMAPNDFVPQKKTNKLSNASNRAYPNVFQDS